jgi:dipeptidyl aminopeptidase/acylaminoacyl peptidase
MSRLPSIRLKRKGQCYGSVAVLCAMLGPAVFGQQTESGVTIEDLVGRVQIPVVALSPDGKNVAYLTVKAMALENLYAVELGIVALAHSESRISLQSYKLSPEATFEPDSGVIRKSAGQMFWNPNGEELAYTTHAKRGMELRVREMETGKEKILLKGFERIEIASGQGGIEITAISTAAVDAEPQTEPEDLGLLMKDGYRFYGMLKNPKPRGKYVVENGEYVWGSSSTSMSNSGPPVYLDFPEEWARTVPLEKAAKKIEEPRPRASRGFPSPDGNWIAVVTTDSDDSASSLLPRRRSEIVLNPGRANTAKSRVLLSPERFPTVDTILGWSGDGRELYYACVEPQSSLVYAVDTDGHRRLIHSDKGALSFSNPSEEISQKAELLTAVRTTNLAPEELISIDLKTGDVRKLLSPNENFGRRSLPVVRYMDIPCCGAAFHGRLYLPTGGKKGTRYPLVFTNYLSLPGFYASVGDEVPILTLTAHGIAVFAMNSRDANVPSKTGQFRAEINRVERPLKAMEWVRRKLGEEGLVDPDRCGLTGLSYGAEIAMYAYWRSNAFRAVSVASGSWEPMNYALAGLSYAEFLNSRGFTSPDDSSHPTWKELSAGLNARPDLPPLLIQSSDGEEFFGSPETWFRLRRAGARVEWHEYPEEGHVKRSPSAKWWVYERNLEWFLFWLKDEENTDSSRSEQYARWREMRKTKRWIPEGGYGDGRQN